MKKYSNLFKHFEKLDFTTKMIGKNVYDITKKNYSNPESLLKFNNSLYRYTYKNGVNWVFSIIKKMVLTR
jgi:hypothetical protein